MPLRTFLRQHGLPQLGSHGSDYNSRVEAPSLWFDTIFRADRVPLLNLKAVDEATDSWTEHLDPDGNGIVDVGSIYLALRGLDPELPWGREEDASREQIIKMGHQEMQSALAHSPEIREFAELTVCRCSDGDRCYCCIWRDMKEEWSKEFTAMLQREHQLVGADLRQHFCRRYRLAPTPRVGVFRIRKLSSLHGIWRQDCTVGIATSTKSSDVRLRIDECSTTTRSDTVSETTSGSGSVRLPEQTASASLNHLLPIRWDSACLLVDGGDALLDVCLQLKACLQPPIRLQQQLLTSWAEKIAQTCQQRVMGFWSSQPKDEQGFICVTLLFSSFGAARTCRNEVSSLLGLSITGTTLRPQSIRSVHQIWDGGQGFAIFTPMADLKEIVSGCGGEPAADKPTGSQDMSQTSTQRREGLRT